MSPATSTTIRGTTATSTRTTTRKPPVSRPTAGVARTLIAAAVVWTLFAFGGAYAWTLVPAAAAIAAAAFLVPPRIAAPGSRTLDLALLASLLCPIVQLTPLPGGWRDTISPHSAAVEQALRFGSGAPGSPALTIDTAATMSAALLAGLVLALFWCARETLKYRGTRGLARAVAWAGLAVSVMAIVVRASHTMLIFGMWSTGYDVEPYGPFVNRNHMGTWLVMALPLVVGYVFSRMDRHARERGPVGAGIDAPMIWLIAAGSAIFVAAIVSLSRSAAIGIAAGGLFGTAMALRRGGRAIPWLVAGAAALAVAIVLSIPKTIELADRFQDSKTTATWARPQIWRETLPIVRDFALTGAGLGSFSTAMLVYQRSDRTLFFNQAHNHYLQLAAEGGLLLIAPLLVAAFAFGARAGARLAADTSPSFWIRTGATAGIIGVLVQSVWETGLRMPANGLLFAMLCAIAIHDRQQQ